MKLRNKKTGEILEDVKYIDTSLTTVEIHYLDNGILRMKTEKDYHSFLQNWEDYEPKEPLIKDEKICKAIKYIFPECSLIHIEKQGGSRIFEFGETRLEIYAPDENAIKHGCSYLVTELCGEEDNA